MPTFEVTAQRGEDIWALLDAEKAAHPEYFCRYPPEFRSGSDSTTAIQTYQVIEAVAEEIAAAAEAAAAEPTTCEVKLFKIGSVCGRDLPCRYHK